MWSVRDKNTDEWVGVVYGDSHRAALERAVQLFGENIIIIRMVEEQPD